MGRTREEVVSAQAHLVVQEEAGVFPGHLRKGSELGSDAGLGGTVGTATLGRGGVGPAKVMNGRPASPCCDL